MKHDYVMITRIYELEVTLQNQIHLDTNSDGAILLEVICTKHEIVLFFRVLASRYPMSGRILTMNERVNESISLSILNASCCNTTRPGNDFNEIN